MKTSHWMGMLFAGALIAVACGDDKTTDDDDDGTGGSTSTSSSSSGTSTSSSSSSGTTDCGAYQVSEEAACQGCAETSCCSQLLACDIGTTCEQLITCLDGCGSDETCADTCMSTHGAGQPAAAALFNCLDTSCMEACAVTGICGGDLGYTSEAMNTCITDSCCASWDPCYADIDCNACLQDPEVSGCDENALLTAYNTCKDANCPTDMCESGIGYYEGGTDPIFDCNVCGDTNCCTSLVTCVGGTVPDPEQAAVDLCIECLTDSGGSTCTDEAIGTAADEFNACIASQCASECGN